MICIPATARNNYPIFLKRHIAWLLEMWYFFRFLVALSFITHLHCEDIEYGDDDDDLEYEEGQVVFRLQSTGQVLYERKISPPAIEIPNWTLCGVCLENPINGCFCWPGPGIKKFGVVRIQLF